MRLKPLNLSVALALMLGAVPALAQDCQSYVGQSVTPQSIDAVMAHFSQIEPKGEFESTAEYQARLMRGIGNVGPLLISKIPDGRNLYDRNGRGDYFQYDADRQVMRVISYAFDNQNFDHNDIWGYGGPLYRSGDYTGRFYNVDVVVSETRRPAGSYQGSNAFGVSRQVRRIASTMNVIYERPLDINRRGGGSLFPAEFGTDRPLGEIPMAPSEAMRLKNTMGIAFVVVPQAPYYVQRTGYPSRATIDVPQEVTRTTRVLFADIQCALLLDGSRVLAAFATQ